MTNRRATVVHVVDVSMGVGAEVDNRGDAGVRTTRFVAEATRGCFALVVRLWCPSMKGLRTRGLENGFAGMRA